MPPTKVLAIMFAAGCVADVDGTAFDPDDSDAPADGIIDAPSVGAPSLSTRGVIRIGGMPMFPIILSLPPPIGSLTPDGHDGLDEVTSAGVNLLKTGPGMTWNADMMTAVRAWNTAAAARGVHTWVNLLQLTDAAPGSADEATLRNVVTTLKDDPGLGLWKGADEPWWGKVSASSIKNAYDVARAIDPVHLWTLIEAPRGTAADLAPYSEVTSLHGIDIYPVGYGMTDPNLHEVGTWTKTIRSVTPDQGIVMALQICWSGSDDPGGSGAFVMATRKQERYMIYDAIMNGARGLSFFGGTVQTCFNASDRQLGWNWTYWNNVLGDLVREIGPHSALYPALLAPGTGLGLVSNNSTTQVMSRQVTDPATGRNHIWVIAARRGTGTATVKISNLPAGIMNGAVYKEGRSIAVANGAFSDSFDHWGVHVYHFVQ